MRKMFSLVLAAFLVVAFCLPTFADEAKVDGKALYASKCAMCHGADGAAKAMAKGSANFNDPAFALGADEIVKVSMAGKNKMPKFEGKLKPEEAAAIAAYIKTLAPKK
jgi:cytochrome c6